VKPGKDYEVAQGLPFSPLLSLEVLDDSILDLAKRHKADLLMYADDGILFSNHAFDTDGPEFTGSLAMFGGVRLEPKKSE